MKNCQTEHGFTLIELMIVIAIIGILAAIALPNYMNYVGRSQTIEGFRATSGIRQDIAIWAAEFQEFPDANAVADNGYIGSQVKSIKGKYIKDNGIKVSADDGKITVEFDKGNISGKNLVMTPTLNQANSEQVIKWVCSGSVGYDKLPSSCQE